MAEARHDHDVHITDDEAYPSAVGPKSPLQHVVQRSSNSDIDEADEDEERSKISQPVKQAAN